MSTFFAFIVACSANCASDCNENSPMAKNMSAFGENYATSSQCAQDWLADARCHVGCDGEGQVIIDRQMMVNLRQCEDGKSGGACTTVDCAEYNRIWLEEGLGGSGTAATSSPAITVSDTGKYNDCTKKCPYSRDLSFEQVKATFTKGDKKCATPTKLTMDKATCYGACGVSYLTLKDRESVVSLVKENKRCEILKSKILEDLCDDLDCDQYYALLGHASALPIIHLFMLACLLV